MVVVVVVAPSRHWNENYLLLACPCRRAVVRFTSLLKGALLLALGVLAAAACGNALRPSRVLTPCVDLLWVILAPACVRAYTCAHCAALCGIVWCCLTWIPLALLPTACAWGTTLVLLDLPSITIKDRQNNTCHTSCTQCTHRGTDSQRDMHHYTTKDLWLSLARHCARAALLRAFALAARRLPIGPLAPDTINDFDRRT